MKRGRCRFNKTCWVVLGRSSCLLFARNYITWIISFTKSNLINSAKKVLCLTKSALALMAMHFSYILFCMLWSNFSTNCSYAVASIEGSMAPFPSSHLWRWICWIGVFQSNRSSELGYSYISVDDMLASLFTNWYKHSFHDFKHSPV